MIKTNQEILTYIRPDLKLRKRVCHNPMAVNVEEQYIKNDVKNLSPRMLHLKL
jgi:hypothetical protein